MEDFKQTKGELHLLTFPYLKARPVWERDIDSMFQLFELADERGPPPEILDPNWNLMDHKSRRPIQLHASPTPPPGTRTETWKADCGPRAYSDNR